MIILNIERLEHTQGEEPPSLALILYIIQLFIHQINQYTSQAKTDYAWSHLKLSLITRSSAS